MKNKIRNGQLFTGDAVQVLAKIESNSINLIIADPPYFQVLVNEDWDNSWKNDDEYIDWTMSWISQCERILAPDGLLYIFGQLGKREHVWLHVCSEITKKLQFHDMIIWDRVVGYNERSDSFTPQYENILVVRHRSNTAPFFNKDAVRIPYDEDTINKYMKDKRYKDIERRREHLSKGKFATNILRVPSLKGASREKVGHPSQKPLELIKMLISSSSRPGDTVLDPFLGSGTTAVASELLGRKWIGIEKDSTYVKIIKERISFLQSQDELFL